MNGTQSLAQAAEDRYAAMERAAFGPEPPCGCDGCRANREAAA